MIIKPTEGQIVAEMKSWLERETSITNFSNGSVTNSFLIAVAKQIVKQYSMLEVYNNAGNISLSSGSYLDLIGEFFGCTRGYNESDTNYRYRIVHMIQIVASSNEESIKMRCMAIEGVKDIIVKKFARGIGTFNIYILTNSPTTPASILTEAQNIINEYQAEGVNGLALSPAPIAVEMKIRVVSKNGITSYLTSSINNGVSDYFDSLKMGDSVAITDINRRIYLSNSDVINFEFLEFKVNGRPTRPSDIKAVDGERLYLRSLVIL